MPIKRCTINGKAGWKYGDVGTCYSGPNGKKKAISQAIAIVSSNPKDIVNLDANKVSVDYDDTASTAKGKELVKRLIDEGKTVYIISARSSKFPIVDAMKDLVPESRIYATGSNDAKVKKAEDLNIGTHYDNNKSVIDKMKEAGIKGIVFHG
jgi:hypothetical protein